MHTYTIIRGRVLEGRSLLLSKIVLKHKYNAKGEVIYKKVRLYIQGDKQTPNITKTRILREWRYKDLGPIEVFIGF